MGIVYPQYWKDGNPELTFRKHLDALKDYFGDAKWIWRRRQEAADPAVLDMSKLESEQPLFKFSMASNAMEPSPVGSPDRALAESEPLKKLWRILDSNVALASHFAEYVKLVKIVMVQVHGSVEDERVFSSLNFLKDLTRNGLDNHLSSVVGMHSQQVYQLESSPFADCFKQWVHSAERHRYGTTA